jgi:hypothetical protein
MWPRFPRQQLLALLFVLLVLPHTCLVMHVPLMRTMYSDLEATLVIVCSSRVVL